METKTTKLDSSASAIRMETRYEIERSVDVWAYADEANIPQEINETNTEPTCEEEWIKTEKTADEQEREIQWLRAENSRLGRELQNATSANNGSTVGLDHDEFVGAWWAEP
ncbi:hypothetical protein O988_05515 [Pseudogymnoascus sp. VKM F-3808]|nr:hypothetical protein O988_05515 [Pseudogymnoascus sp. VKM F-3808]KFY30280.1 hypothetical protein V494_08197 [Pseudogymnoascus sp. VKM F-4513 (FW-928)]